MEKQSYGQHSWLKKVASDHILSYIRTNIKYHSKQVSDLLIKFNKNIQIIPRKKYECLNLLPEEAKKELLVIWDIVDKAKQEEDRISWYLSRLLSNAVDMVTVRKCIPEYCWKYLNEITVNGELTVKDLYDQECYDIIEQSQIKNLILVI